MPVCSKEAREASQLPGTSLQASRARRRQEAKRIADAKLAAAYSKVGYLETLVAKPPSKEEGDLESMAHLLEKLVALVMEIDGFANLLAGAASLRDAVPSSVSTTGF